jgi:hypothetical protein
MDHARLSVRFAATEQALPPLIGVTLVVDVSSVKIPGRKIG